MKIPQSLFDTFNNFLPSIFCKFIQFRVQANEIEMLGDVVF